MSEYRICTNCILDTIDDPNIHFDEEGVCNYCREYKQLFAQNKSLQGEERDKKLKELVSVIREAGEGKKYDCVIGLSGGVDSTYLAYFVKQQGLRPLAIHYDNGWNTELAVKNIENIVSRLGIDLLTYVNDWEEFADLQRSFFKASVIDIELLTDHAISAILFKTARQLNVKHIIMGSNISTESILPPHWYHWKQDALNITSIHRIFGKRKLRTFPLLGFFELQYYQRVLKIKTVSLLNYTDYIKEDAKRLITEKLDWRDYGGKHHESLFTRFFQSYILPVKFNVDKRKAHLSSLICSGQITREEALLELKKDIYDKDLLRHDKEYVLKKLDLTEDEFTRIMKMPVKQHTDYPSYLTKHYKYQLLVSRMMRPLKKLLVRSK